LVGTQSVRTWVPTPSVGTRCYYRATPAPLMSKMAHFDFPFWALYRVLENHLLLAEAASFPEVSRLGAGRARVCDRLRQNLRRLIVTTPPATLHRRHLGGDPAVRTVAV